MHVKPFKVAVPGAEIDDPTDRLALTRWPDMILGSDWTYGIDLAWAQQMAAYWRDGFDWRKQEAMLNAFPPFTTTLDGQTAPFIHVRSPEPNALPFIWTPRLVEHLSPTLLARSAR